jgi:hypothetical protein
MGPRLDRGPVTEIAVRGTQRRNHRALGEPEPIAAQRARENPVLAGTRRQHHGPDIDRVLIRLGRIADRATGK